LGNQREHHDARGGFRNPWPTAVGEDRRAFDFFRWQWQRRKAARHIRPGANEFPRGAPNIAYPSAPPYETRITWVGHSTFLIQSGGINLLTDPVWSLRASPVSWIGPTRLTPPGVGFEDLPPIHVVLISHDHYDHLDVPTVSRLARSFAQAQWYAPLGHAPLLRKHGVRHIEEMDWWDERSIVVDNAAVQLTALPVQHWTRRIGSGYRARLWCSFALRASAGNIFFTGDSGYCPAFKEIGDRLGPFDVALLPIGAYEPRWFMRMAHMNPEEALQSYLDVRADHFVAMHWATFWLTDEHPLEPAQRIRAAWKEARLAEEKLHVLGVGETLMLRGSAV
jgi:N-acyl-phosphatidylethanolamine-hydrolysing phospholipase D